jgi:hypothetical protein
VCVDYIGDGRQCSIRCKFCGQGKSVCDYLCFNVCPSNVWKNNCYCVQNYVKWESCLSETTVFNFQSLLKTWLVAYKNLKEKNLLMKMKSDTAVHRVTNGCRPTSGYSCHSGLFQSLQLVI